MELRSHPSMTYRGTSNWPPVWNTAGTGHRKCVRGEIGTLKSAWISRQEPQTLCILTTVHDDTLYTALLYFDDSSFCRRCYNLFTDHRGKSIADIASMEIGDQPSNAEVA